MAASQGFVLFLEARRQQGFFFSPLDQLLVDHHELGKKGTDLFIDDRQAVFLPIPLTADDPATAPLALPTVRQYERSSYAAWIVENIVAGEWELIRTSLQWGQRTNSSS